MLAGALKYTAQFTGIISNFSFDQLFMAFILQRRIVFFFLSNTRRLPTTLSNIILEPFHTMYLQWYIYIIHVWARVFHKTQIFFNSPLATHKIRVRIYILYKRFHSCFLLHVLSGESVVYMRPSICWGCAYRACVCESFECVCELSNVCELLSVCDTRVSACV